jgi:hypothetical protein
MGHLGDLLLLLVQPACECEFLLLQFVDVVS